jgi:hypothetical protein
LPASDISFSNSASLDVIGTKLSSKRMNAEVTGYVSRHSRVAAHPN